jgi:hypothetical protein
MADKNQGRRESDKKAAPAAKKDASKTVASGDGDSRGKSTDVWPSDSRSRWR